MATRRYNQMRGYSRHFKMSVAEMTKSPVRIYITQILSYGYNI